MHHMFLDAITARQGELATIEGEEARHALRVKRLTRGDRLRLLDGRGSVADATIESSDKNGPGSTWRLHARVTASRTEPPPSPAVWIVCPAPKGDLLETMIDQLGQVGAAGWIPLRTARSERTPRPGRMQRLARVAVESAKQCRRPWLLDIKDEIDFSHACRLHNAVLARAAAPTPARVAPALTLEPDPRIHVLIGPEGGLNRAERDAAENAALPTVGLGPHVLRIGTAAVVAASGFVLDGNTPGPAAYPLIDSPARGRGDGKPIV